MGLCTKDTHSNVKQAQEAYFYQAVMIGSQYLWEGFWEHKWGKFFFDAYLLPLANGITPLHMDEPIFSGLVRTGIEHECAKRRKSILEEAAKTDTFLEGTTCYSDIINRIEKAFWPIRLLIISVESGEPITIHGMKEDKIKSIEKSARKYEYTLVVDILGQPREYRVIIDHGTSEPKNRPKPAHIDTILNPILRRHIQKKENAVISYADDYRRLTERVERTMEMPRETDNYSEFIKMIIWDTRDTSIPAEVRDNQEYAKECHQALDLARLLTLGYATSDSSREDIIASIDTILGGEITRNVLNMTRTILISRAEMMSGSGCPYGLSKKDIPLEARIYTIIRSYEALCKEEKNLETVRIRLNEWNQWGFFDVHLFSIFMKFLEKWGSTPEKSIYTHNWGVPRVRKQYYQDFLADYDELRGLVEKIEEAYRSFHNAANNISERKRLAIIINNLQDLLVGKDQSPKIFAVTGHGQSPSDTIPGQPGDDNEWLTAHWRQSSDEKWMRFWGMSITMYSSPIRRARITARHILWVLKQVSGEIRKIILVEGLQNPRKDLPNVRGNNAITKLLVDHPFWILDFLRRIVFSPRESVNVVVAHGTTSSYLLWILENLGSRDSINMHNVDIAEHTIVVRLVRWGRLVEWDLLFPFEDWRWVLDEVNTICEGTFGEEFFVRKWWNIHLVSLHKKFLDFMDKQNEKSPQKVAEFLTKLDEGVHTKNFRSVLWKSGFIF